MNKLTSATFSADRSPDATIQYFEDLFVQQEVESGRRMDENTKISYIISALPDVYIPLKVNMQGMLASGSYDTSAHVYALIRDFYSNNIEKRGGNASSFQDYKFRNYNEQGGCCESAY